MISGRPAPDPAIDGKLSHHFVEWMMGLPSGWVCDAGLSRRQALGVLGNGVVPQQAAQAISSLAMTLLAHLTAAPGPDIPAAFDLGDVQ